MGPLTPGLRSCSSCTQQQLTPSSSRHHLPLTTSTSRYFLQQVTQSQSSHHLPYRAPETYLAPIILISIIPIFKPVTGLLMFHCRQSAFSLCGFLAFGGIATFFSDHQTFFLGLLNIFLGPTNIFRLRLMSSQLCRSIHNSMTSVVEPFVKGL